MSKTIYPATLLCDFYKISHREQYPQKTEVVFSTWTPRSSLIPGVNKAIAFGFQGFIKKYLMEYFKEHFFDRPQHEVVDEYKRFITATLGIENPSVKHIVDLHSLGYIPVRIRALEEGTAVPIRVPMLTIENTDSRFFWITNYLETIMSCVLWQPSTSATLALEYRKILELFAQETSDTLTAVKFQGHDFSMRGMGGLDAAASSGAGHLLSFCGTDTIPAICYLEEYYNADITEELVGTSIPATEHSVMCSYGRDELSSYTHLIKDVYPTGLLSIVSDTWDLWKVLTDVIAPMKNTIMERDGKIVIRPDSGDPVDILCGTVIVREVEPETSPLRLKVKYSHLRTAEDAYFKTGKRVYRLYTNNDGIYECEQVELTPEQKGVIEVLWEIFGGKRNSKGYKELDSHIGAIYGDAITLERCTRICEKLKRKGFASTNVVFGIGSFTYQYNTRDTLGFALKSTYVKINGRERHIYKDPATDKKKIKKSQTGLVCVVEDANEINFIDGVTESGREHLIETVDLLRDIFIDGQLLIDDSLANIRKRMEANI